MKILTQKKRAEFNLPYKQLAEKYGTSYLYVWQIANGERKAIRGKGLQIRKELEVIFSK